VVLRLSNLLTVEPEQRRAFLDACARHADLLVVETLPLGRQPPPSVRIDKVESGVVHGGLFLVARPRARLIHSRARSASRDAGRRA
jgi:hypothetical protein